MMGHLNSFSASGGGNLNKNFPKNQMPAGVPGGMLKLRFDWYIRPERPLRPPKTPKLENKDPPYFSELQNYDQPVANATES